MDVRQGSDGHNSSEIMQADNAQRGPAEAITTSLPPAKRINYTIDYLNEAGGRAWLPEKTALSLESTPKKSPESVNDEPNLESVSDNYGASYPDMENPPGSQERTAIDATFDAYQQEHQKSHEDRPEQAYKKNSPSGITHGALIGQVPPTPILTVIETEPSSPTGPEDELDASMRDTPLSHADLGPPNETEDTSNGDALLIHTHADYPIETVGELLTPQDNIEILPFSDNLSSVEENATNLSANLSAYDNDLRFFNPAHEMYIDLNNPLLFEPFPCMDCGELEIHKYRCNIISRSPFQFP
jgi:hypothetical protein